MQKNAVTIQQEITEAIQIILKEKVTLTGSGRTDAGVHALGQTANFKTAKEIDIYKFNYQLNSLLPPEVSVNNIEKTKVAFNARFDAKKRTYIYLISKNKTPFYNKFSWHIHRALDTRTLNTISNFFIGKKDFSAFCKTASETKNKVCEVYKIFWYEKENIIIFSIEADRFLHGMVRTIIGTLLEALEQPDPGKYLSGIFENKNRSLAGESVPAKGLFLYRVKYDD